MARRVFEAKVQIRFQPNERLEHLVANLDQLLDDPAVFPALLREIVTQTLFVAYQTRFQRAKPDWLRGPEKASQAAAASSDEDKQQRLASLGERYRKALNRGQKDLIDRLSDQINNVLGLSGESRVSGEEGATYGPRAIKGPGSLSTGLFETPRLDEVLAAFTNVADIKTETVNGRPSITFGSTERMDRIKAPSATEHVIKKPHPTESKFQVLWRQLEFGTGIYAKASPFPTNTNPINKQSDGSWWYGPRVGMGLHLRGAKAGNFLRNASGIAYTDYGIRFAAALAAKLTAWLERSR